MSAPANSLKSILFALGANLAIAAAKTAGAVFTGSASMLAEAIHSFADCANQALLLVGMREAERPANPRYPLGHGRAIYFWSFIVALMLFSMGGVFSIYEGVHKLGSHEPLQYAWVAIAILAFSIVAESISLWGCLREVNKIRGGLSLWRWFRSTRHSELLVVFAEDSAALAGLSTALAFVVATLLTGNPMWDAVGSIVIGVILVVVALVVGVEVKALLIGESAHPQIAGEMRTHVERDAEVAEVFNLLTQQLGADVMVAVKARMRPTGSEAGLVAAINRVEARLRAAFPQVRWVFFEPDVAD